MYSGASLHANMWEWASVRWKYVYSAEYEPVVYIDYGELELDGYSPEMVVVHIKMTNRVSCAVTTFSQPPSCLSFSAC